MTKRCGLWRSVRNRITHPRRTLFPAYISFGGTSYKKMVEELSKIEGAVGNRPSFGGFAIHHYDSYRKLCGE